MMELTCIICPMGCSLTVKEENGELKVYGNTCKRGEKYAKDEVISPSRTLTTSVRADNGAIVSVKSENPIPKKLLLDAVKEIAKIEVKCPVCVGDVVLENILDTGVNIIATKAV